MRKNYLLSMVFVLMACFFSVNAANVPKKTIASITTVSTDTLFYVDFKSKPGTFTSGDIFTASTGNANKTTTVNTVIFGAGPNGERINMNPTQSASQFNSGATTYVSATANDDGATAGAFSFIKSGGSGAGGGYIILPDVQGPTDITIWSCGANTGNTQSYNVLTSVDGGTTWSVLGTTSITDLKLIYKNSFSYHGNGVVKVKLLCTTGSSANCNLYIYDVLMTASPSLVLTSAIGSDNQTVTTALSESISNIVYTWGSIATSAAITWTGTTNATTPPAGITVTTDPVAKTVTISGTPTVNGIYGYSLTSTDGNLITSPLTGTISVVSTPVPLISLTSAAGTNTQKVNAGNVLTGIQYTWAGSATIANIVWSGTADANTPPDGITVTKDLINENINIAGIPTTPGTYSWSVSSTDGTLMSPSLSGTLTVVPPPTLTLTSAAGTDNQTVAFCQNITGIVYTYGGSATSATVTWSGTGSASSPAGVNATINSSAKTVTISGMPYVTGNYGYSITATDGTLVTTPVKGKISSSESVAALPSFPGAVGYGSHATGGRNGSVYHVTNLNDSGTGSFRDAVSSSNRIIVFDVSGYIHLLTAVSARSNLTIAGQTAPGEGIGLYGGELSFANSSNIILRDVRIVPGGQTSSSTDDALSLYLAQNVIVDHCSIEFAPWNNIDGVSDNYTVYPVTAITFQNCLDADPTGQQFGAHCESVISQWTFYRNIFANSHNRNPLAKINDTFINNVHYNNEAGYTTHTSTSFNHDIVNNYFIYGPASSSSTDNPWFQMDGNQSIYYPGNMLDNDKDGTLNGATTTPYWYSGTAGTTLTAPWSPLTSTIPTVSAASAYRIATSTTGRFPYDQLDSLIINQVKTLGSGTTGYTAGTTGPSSGLYNSDQTETGLPNNGYGIIRSGAPVVDTDNDGMPDYWEAATGSNVNADDAMTIGSDGYTLIEHYLNWIAGFHALTNVNSAVDIDMNKFTGGFTSVSPVFAINANTNGTATLLADKHTIHFVPSTGFIGLGSFKFTVTGSDNTAYTDTVSVLVGNNVLNGINEVKNRISIYPNPASHVLTLQNPEAGTYAIYDVVGRLALTGKVKESGVDQQIDISRLVDGVFTLKVTSNNSTQSYNFIKKQ